VPQNLLRKVQSVQNAAARLLTNARQCKAKEVFYEGAGPSLYARQIT